MAFDDQHAINSLATILHLAGGGAITSPGSTTTGLPSTGGNQLGQQYLDQATRQASTSAAGTTTTTSSSTTGTTTSGDTGGIIDPVPQGTPVTQGYGVNGHPGIDLGVPLNTQLLAAQSGTVTQAENDDPNGTHSNDFGNIITITTADGYQVRYGHLHNMNVRVGDTVRAGQIIGTSGGEQGGPTSGNSEGPHLHFEVRGPDGNTVDPTPWLAGGHQIVDANPSQVTVTTAPNPESQMGATIANIMDVAAGKNASHQTQMDTTTTTKPGSSTTAGTGSTSDSDPGAVDAFLAATRQHESGGDYTIYNTSGQSNASGAYQFLNSTWKSAGGSTEAAAQASPAEQDRVARAMALQLFNQFHSWRLVAIAWYGGPGVAQQVASGSDPGSPEGQGGYVAYGDTIQRMMSGGG